VESGPLEKSGGDLNPPAACLSPGKKEGGETAIVSLTIGQIWGATPTGLDRENKQKKNQINPSELFAEGSNRRERQEKIK